MLILIIERVAMLRGIIPTLHLRGGVRRLRTLASPPHRRQKTTFCNNTLKREIHSFLSSSSSFSIIAMAMDAHHLSTRGGNITWSFSWVKSVDPTIVFAFRFHGHVKLINRMVVGSPHVHALRASSSSGQSSAGVGREILVQHLLVKDDNVKLLLELQKRIAEGEDMSDLAVDYSICPSKEEGGMLGWVRRGQMVPEFEKAAFDAPVNKVVKCKTKFGWHLLQVLSEREESVLEDIQPDHLHEKLQDPCFLEEAQLIDVREPHEVAQASLPGFQVLPLRQFGNWGPEITTKFDPQKDTYVLCHHGVRSLQVAQWLQTQGFKKVFNVSGGIHAYALKADPSIPTY